jgi:hypothetical protein
MPISKKQFSAILAAIACLLHTLCFDWSWNPYDLLITTIDPSAFWQFTLTSASGEENTLYLFYDFSYGNFQGVRLLLALAGIATPIILLMIAGAIYWNDNQTHSNKTN